jgi:hypothetical protein
MPWNAKIKPEGFCAVRPTAFFGKFAPYWPIRSLRAPSPSLIPNS